MLNFIGQWVLFKMKSDIIMNNKTATTGPCPDFCPNMLDINAGVISIQILKQLKRVALLIALFSLLFFSSGNLFAQGFYTYWINNARGSAPETCVASAVDIGTNVYFLGRYYGYTNHIASTTLTNQIAISNLFLAKFNGSSVAVPAWAKVVVTDYPISNARLVDDFNGDIVVAGSFGGTNLGFGGGTLTNYDSSGNYSEDVFVAKFNTSGTLGELIQMGGTAEDTLGDLKMDPARTPSGFYVTGSFQSTNFVAGVSNLTRLSTSGADFYVAKYNLSGSLLWINQGAYAAGTCIAIDSSNNCYVGGTTLGPASFNGASPSNPITTNFLAKYDNKGDLLWVRGDVPVGSQMYVDKNQNIYLAGTFNNALQFGNVALSNSAPSTIFVAKCDTNGTPLWAESLPGWGYDSVGGITIDSVQNCWVAGYFASSPSPTGLPTNSIAVLGCFDSSGNVLATSQITGAGPSTASSVSGIFNNFNGNICVSGTYSTNLDFYHSPYSPYKDYAVTNNNGTCDIFATTCGVLPELRLTASGTNLICSWPSLVDTFQLQTVTNLSGSSWTTVGLGAVSTNGQMVVTNSISGGTRFYRLIIKSGP
jgi:hypothetical protein